MRGEHLDTKWKHARDPQTFIINQHESPNNYVEFVLALHFGGEVG